MHRTGAFRCNFQYLYTLSPFVLAVKPQRRTTVFVSMSQTSQLVRTYFPKQVEIGIKALEMTKLVFVHLLLPSWEGRHLVSPPAQESVTMGWVHIFNPVNLIVHKAP